MRIQIVQVPYDAGHRSVRMGGGPEHFVRNGVGVASYDPDYDSENRMLRTGINLMEALTGYYSADER